MSETTKTTLNELSYAYEDEEKDYYYNNDANVETENYINDMLDEIYAEMEEEPKTFEERLKQDMKKEQVDSWGMIEKKFKNSK